VSEGTIENEKRGRKRKQQEISNTAKVRKKGEGERNIDKRIRS
jgi:hypothetical protein